MNLQSIVPQGTPVVSGPPSAVAVAPRAFPLHPDRSLCWQTIHCTHCNVFVFVFVDRRLRPVPEANRGARMKALLSVEGVYLLFYGKFVWFVFGHCRLQLLLQSFLSALKANNARFSTGEKKRTPHHNLALFVQPNPLPQLLVQRKGFYPFASKLLFVPTTSGGRPDLS